LRRSAFSFMPFAKRTQGGRLKVDSSAGPFKVHDETEN